MSSSTKAGSVFAKRLREARELRAINQEDLARKSGLQPSAVSHFETGTRKPSFDNLRRLADALEVTTDYLIGRASDISGVAAPGEMYRKLEGLTDADREMVQAFVDTLAQRRSGSRK